VREKGHRPRDDKFEEASLLREKKKPSTLQVVRGKQDRLEAKQKIPRSF